MDTLFSQGYCDSSGSISGHGCRPLGSRHNETLPAHDSVDSTDHRFSYDSFLGTYPDRDGIEVPEDYSDACLKFINEILMEEDLDDCSPATLEGHEALQATEKSLFDAIQESYPNSTHQPSLFFGQNIDCPDADIFRYSTRHVTNAYPFAETSSIHAFPNAESSSTHAYSNAESSSIHAYSNAESFCVLDPELMLHQSCIDTQIQPLANSSCLSIVESNCPSYNSHNSFPHDAVGGGSSTLVTACLPSKFSLDGALAFDLPREAPENEPNYISFCIPRGKKESRVKNKDEVAAKEVEKGDSLVSELRRGRKIADRDDSDVHDIARSSKQVAAYDEYAEIGENFDLILNREDQQGESLSTNEVNRKAQEEEQQKQDSQKGTRRRRNRNRKKKESNDNRSKRAVVDLRTLLSHCAQAVSSFDLNTANDLLRQIREHSSPYGDGVERLAHYYANGLEARIAGTGSQLCTGLVNTRVPVSDSVRAYLCHFTAVPVSRAAFFLANQAIAKLGENATRIHIVDFGIFQGFQWPSLIQQLSRRPTGPPMLRITGIDYPQGGFKPLKLLEATGRRLAGFCERFNVPFEYHPIAQIWDTIKPEDIKIDRENELVIVNCQFRAVTLLDETVEVNNPRDTVLRLIRKLNPDLFVHGIVNGTFGAPFFITRFREALFFHSSIYDMFEATMPREEYGRLLLERELHGKQVLNVIACEGMERRERPETYKQWQVRKSRAGLKQVPWDRDITNKLRAIVKAYYHKDFVIDEDGGWVLQGWKGRILYAFSCWKPA